MADVSRWQKMAGRPNPRFPTGPAIPPAQHYIRIAAETSRSA
jgi:hypothetical protein